MKTKLSFSMLLLQSGRPLSCESSSKRYYFCLWWNIRKIGTWSRYYSEIQFLCLSAYCFVKQQLHEKLAVLKTWCVIIWERHTSSEVFYLVLFNKKKQELQICRLFLLRVKLQNVPKSWKYLLNVLKTLTLFN